MEWGSMCVGLGGKGGDFGVWESLIKGLVYGSSKDWGHLWLSNYYLKKFLPKPLLEMPVFWKVTMRTGTEYGGGASVCDQRGEAGTDAASQ